MENLTFGINGSLRKREVLGVATYTEHYLFNSQANLKAYSNNLTDFAYYGYNASNTRTYKLGFLGGNQWVNGQPEPLSLQFQQAMFYPNAYINFNHNGEYTKHYYNGAERIASRLGNSRRTIVTGANSRLQARAAQMDELFKGQIIEMLPYEEPVSAIPDPNNGGGMSDPLYPTVEYYPIPTFTELQITGSNTDIFYYHTNHLGSTAYVTDQNRNVTQGFLYAPFGEITTEYNATFGNDIIPKYSFNAKELDEETGMYYYEARYYKPPVFTSRDAMFEKYFWMTPYAYCANNPVKYVDPSGDSIDVSRLSKSALEQYNAGIQKLQKSPLFSAYYNALQKSPNIYYIEEGAGKGGSGSFESNRSVVSAVLDNLYALSQELFHAFQSDCNFYTSKDASVRETEGDIAAQLVMYELESFIPSDEWSSQMFDYMEDYVGILNPQFSKVFSNMVDLRIDFYKQRELQDGAIAPKSYIQANSGKPPLALQMAIKLINSK